MPNINIRLSDEQLTNLKKLAANENTTVTDFILKHCGLSTNTNDLSINDVILKIKKLPVGTKFSLKSIYDYDTWASFNKNSKISTGRIFFKSYQKNDFGLQQIVKFLGKSTSNLAMYERI